MLHLALRPAERTGEGFQLRAGARRAIPFHTSTLASRFLQIACTIRASPPSYRPFLLSTTRSTFTEPPATRDAATTKLTVVNSSTSTQANLPAREAAIPAMARLVSSNSIQPRFQATLKGQQVAPHPASAERTATSSTATATAGAASRTPGSTATRTAPANASSIAASNSTPSAPGQRGAKVPREQHWLRGSHRQRRLAQRVR